jgi:subtilisin family serine protease
MRYSIFTIVIILATALLVATDIPSETTVYRRSTIDYRGVDFDSLKDHYPGRLNICFSATLLGNTTGQIEISIVDGIVHTPIDWFNALAVEYQIVSLNRLFRVKDTTFHRNGCYPMNIFQLMIKNPDEIDNLMQALLTYPDILFAEYDPVLRQTYIPSDPLISNQWYLRNIDAFRAWDFVTDASDIIIGIVDSGTKWNHVDLKDNIWINHDKMDGIEIDWVNGLIIGGNGIDFDGNGFIDDVMGWDFVTDSITWGQSNNPFQVFPGNEHGTHVAGCAAAVGDNGIGVAGPAFSAKLMNTKHSFTNEATNFIFFGYEGIIYCADNGAHIINCSWGGRGGADVANTVVSYATAQGALVFASAGNSNQDNTYINHYPSDADDAVSVAATGQDDVRTSFSCYGILIDVAAPGSSILATYYDDSGNDSYATASGTSMASPIVAGVAALILAEYPHYTTDQLLARLKAGCDPIDHLHTPAFAGKLGAGRVNAFSSLMHDRLPYVTYHYTEVVAISTGETVLKPGNSIEFKINLKNRENWLSALPSHATLSTTSSFVNIVNDMVTFPAIPAGTDATSTESFLIDIAIDCPIESHILFQLTYFADAGVGFTQPQDVFFTISVTLDKEHWPYSSASSSVTSSLVFDIDGDGVNELIFLDTSKALHIMDISKNHLPGFPVALDIANPNLITIISSRGSEHSQPSHEILITGGNKIIKVDHSGNITAQRQVSGTVFSSAVVYDLHDDGDEVIAIGTHRGDLYILHSDLTDYPLFPINLGSPILSKPIFIDFDKNGKVDIVVNTSNRNLNIISIETATHHEISPINTQINVTTGLVAVKNDSETLILCVGSLSHYHNMKIISSSGNTRATYTMTIPVSTLPIITSLDGSDEIHIIVVTSAGSLYVFDTLFNVREGFPIHFGGVVNQHPILADLDGDGSLEIIIPVNNGNLYAIKHDGTVMAPFPYTFSSEWFSSPVFADIEMTGKAALLISNYDHLYYLDLPYTFKPSSYPMYAIDRTRNAVYTTDRFIPDLDITIPKSEKHAVLHGNYPNPFNPVTQIRFSIANFGKPVESAVIEIFDIKGRKVETLPLSKQNIHNGYMHWDAQKSPSGVYLYRLSVDDTPVAVRKAVLLK